MMEEMAVRLEVMVLAVALAAAVLATIKAAVLVVAGAAQNFPEQEGLVVDQVVVMEGRLVMPVKSRRLQDAVAEVVGGERLAAQAGRGLVLQVAPEVRRLH